MNKKILIGSIIAVVILILVSFTSAVGFHSVKSTSAINTPLFGIRIRRAIGQEQQDITTDYLGHGAETNIHLSSRMKKAEQVQKVIDTIRNMDDRAFSKFVSRIILNLKYQTKMTDKEISDVLKALHYIKGNPKEMKYFDRNDISLTFIITCAETFKYLTCWESPLCLIKTIYWLFEFIFIWIVATFMITGCNCITMWCTEEFTQGGCCKL
ncbi:MAG: hypothetical protein JSW06_08380 [Thermoplasmatales archaeon]|nr:MAG: hypothetical protein JSW06_08380 [Thermoplasmatales archaeon]